MENATDLKFWRTEKPKIPQVLIDVTYDSFRRGQRKDGFTVSAENLLEDEQKVKKKKGKHDHSVTRRGRRKVVEVEDEDADEGPYRAHGERRMAFLMIGDQHRLGRGKGGLTSYLYPDAPPIDFSFSLLSSIEEITTSGDPPSMKRNYKFPEKTEDERYRTSSVRLSYNLLENLEGLISVLYKILDGGPLGLVWIDLSFNRINSIDDESIGQIPNVRILYLHGNAIADFTEIPKLQGLTQLHTLTMHGNPIEEENAYRACMIYYLPNLKHLDFVGVTRSDQANAHKYGKMSEPHWRRRHVELENQARQYQAAQEISYTEKLMKEPEEEEDVDFKAFHPD